MSRPSENLTSHGDARPTKRQHARPCGDCPFRRNALPGWLGGVPLRYFARLIHDDETSYPCHARRPADRPEDKWQCAGLATIRANVLKVPRDRAALAVPADYANVFTSERQFVEHHRTREYTLGQLEAAKNDPRKPVRRERLPEDGTPFERAEWSK